MLRLPTFGSLGAALAALALALAAPLAWAQGAAKNAVESINFSQAQGGKILVKVGLKEPLAALPQGFAVTNPPRIAIDLPDTTNGLNRTQVEAGGPRGSVSGKWKFAPHARVQYAHLERVTLRCTRLCHARAEPRCTIPPVRAAR